MHLSLPTRRVRVLAVAAALTAAPVSALAQGGRSPIAASIQAAVARAGGQGGEGGPVRSLSVDEAVRLALEQNLGIRIQRIDPQVQDVGVAQAKSFWAPNFSSVLSTQSQTQQPTSALSGGATSILNNTVSNSVGLNQVLPWGGSYSASFNNSRYTTTSFFTNYSPQLNSTVNLTYTQPLVRNFPIDQIRQQVQNSQKTRELSDLQLQSVITQVMRNVKNAYWDLSYSIANLKAQQQSLALSQQSLQDNRKRVEIGTLAPIDIVQAQAEVAMNEQGVIVADAAIKTAQDNLRTLILDPGTPDFWTTAFEPTDEPAFASQPVDLDAIVRNALDKRLDLLAAKNSMAISDVNIRYFRNQLLPDVSAQVNYITTAAGGTQFAPFNFNAIPTGEAVTRSVVSTQSFGSVLGNVFGSTYPNWTVGVQVGYPLGSSTSQANLARARLQYEQAQNQMKNLETQVVMQVRATARNVQTNVQRVQSARASRELQEKKLEAEEKKLAAGMSSTFLVFQAQRDLSVARVAEIQAISDYNKSLVDLEAVQVTPLPTTNPSQQIVPLGGPASGITIAGTGAVQTGGSAIIRQQ
jgi:outer membrane protein TolC